MASTAKRAGLGYITGGLTELPSLLSGSEQMREDAERERQEQAGLRWESKQKQLGLLENMRAPEASSLTRARLAALQEESKPGALVEDPLFQGDRTRLLQGGTSELAGVGNIRRGYGMGSGGFRNVGSEQDIADRVGAQLAALGQQSRQVKEQKRDIASELQQSIDDAKINYANSITQAKMAIEAGDSQAASMAIQQAYAARQAASAADRQMAAALISGGSTIAGAALGAPTAKPKTSSYAPPESGSAEFPSSDDFSIDQNIQGPRQPFSNQRRYSLGVGR